MEQKIQIPEIYLNWSAWHPWPKVGVSGRSRDGIKIPAEPGVYEVKGINEDHRLTIGRATDLQKRIRRQLVLGKGKHSTGKRIRATEEVHSLIIRWATTTRPCAVEEELHWQHKNKHGKLPTYTMGT